jgi:hypothetical protein
MKVEFSEKDLQEFRRSGITGNQASAAGFARCEDIKELAKAMRSTKQAKPGWLVPYYDLDGKFQYRRLKPDEPRVLDGKVVKYEQPQGIATQIYYPYTHDREKFLDQDEPLIIVEGEKKALKGCLEGFTCIAVPGVDNFYEKAEPGQPCQLKKDFTRLITEGRKVYVCYDAGKMKNLRVLRAEVRLTEELLAVGAQVYLVQLPELSVTKDTGLDDFLVARSAEAFKQLMDRAWLYPIEEHLQAIGKEGITPEMVDIAVAYCATIRDKTRKTAIKAILEEMVGKANTKVLSKDLSAKDFELACRAAENGELASDEIKDLIDRCRISPIAMLGKPRSKFISELVVQCLIQKGTFLYDGNICYYFDFGSREVSIIDRGSFDLVAYRQFGINPEAEEHRHILSEIECHTKENGLKTTLRKMSHYDSTKNTLYYWNGNTEVIKITIAGYAFIQNGDDGVYFETDPEYVPFEMLEKYEQDFMFKVFKLFNLDQSRLSLWQIYDITRLFIYYGFFYTDKRPMLHFLGTFNSAKTTLARLVVKIIQGPDGEVSADFSKKDDVVAKLKNSSIMCWDNVESVPDEMLSLLCSVVSGCMVEMRKLFSNGEQVKFRPSVMILLTSRETYFTRNRPDFADRLLTLRLNQIPIKERREEREIYALMGDGRNHFFTQFVAECPKMLQNLLVKREEGFFRCEARMVDFYAFLARLTGDSERITKIVSGVVGEVAQSALENCTWFVALQNYVASIGGEYTGKTGRLLEKIREYAQKHLGCHLEVKSDVSFGKILKEQTKNLGHYFIVEHEKKQNSNYYTFILREDVKDNPIVVRQKVTDLSFDELTWQVANGLLEDPTDEEQVEAPARPEPANHSFGYDPKVIKTPLPLDHSDIGEGCGGDEGVNIGTPTSSENLYYLNLEDKDVGVVEYISKESQKKKNIS